MEIKEQNINNQLALSAIRLLAFEESIRKVKSKDEFIFHICNKLRELISYDFSVFCSIKNGRVEIRGVSDVTEYSESSEYLEYVKNQLVKLYKNNDDEMLGCEFDQHPSRKNFLSFFKLKNYNEDDVKNNHKKEYYIAIITKKGIEKRQVELLKKVLTVYFYSMSYLRFTFNSSKFNKLKLFVLFISLLCLIPFPSSIIAPVEVVAKAPFIVTAPFDGVVDKVLVDVNQDIEEGTKLILFDDLLARNEFRLADKKFQVSQAKLANVQELAFYDNKASYEIPVTKTELELAKLERDYAQEILNRTIIFSNIKGVPIFTNKSDIEGRPVKMGEKIIEIANPTEFKYKIAIPVHELSQVKKGSEVSIYLDSAPLGGYSAKIESVSFLPSEQNNGEISYTAYALTSSDYINRIGARGTARIYGDYSPLILQMTKGPFHHIRMVLGL
ncbi:MULTISPECIES: efflux RND transporter periplasmic adaptor subunit [unclassified Vibrio]|uniref:HlyD family efflux transporter periplasmic adaptor subunit n=1 Tax=Vibrio sp. HB236076 TaxID=3232307 RepID=A0AB39HH71_9VIBR|nr:HlyD family efflux transporter periplasmic adaptor subunit [Vibrio sp. HB161653]MDP5255139.1 HlyD family efflux transporter periplasmic adaptor subunit [Vibrio sp. HB161653]